MRTLTTRSMCSPLTVSDTSSVGSSDVCANRRGRLPRVIGLMVLVHAPLALAIRRTKVATARRW